MSFYISSKNKGSVDSTANHGTQSQEDTMSLGSSGSRPRLLRTNSIGMLRDSVLWLGEQAQTQFLDRNLEAHAKDDGSAQLSTSSPTQMSQLSSLSKLLPSYNAVADPRHTIRFQVVVWSISPPDVKSHQVSMKFRVTVFWNGPPLSRFEPRGEEQRPKGKGSDKAAQYHWVMSSRSTACRKKISDDPAALMAVPPVSILNADRHEVIGAPEVTLLREDTQLFRWSCMYRAQLHQNDISVYQFPHDEHDLVLKLGVLSHRQPGGMWDRRKWRLGLANSGDTQGSIRIPYGVLVDQVKIPGFYTDKDGLNFELVPLEHGSALQTTRDPDYCLVVKLKVKRNSGKKTQLCQMCSRTLQRRCQRHVFPADHVRIFSLCAVLLPSQDITTRISCHFSPCSTWSAFPSLCPRTPPMTSTAVSSRSTSPSSRWASECPSTATCRA